MPKTQAQLTAGLNKVFAASGNALRPRLLKGFIEDLIEAAPLSGDDISDRLVTPTGGSVARTLGDWLGAIDATISASTYTLLATDHGKTLSFTAGCTVTVPAGLPANFVVGLIQAGASQITLTASSTTIREPDSQLKSERQWVTLSLIALASDVFLLSGRTAP